MTDPFKGYGAISSLAWDSYIGIFVYFPVINYTLYKVHVMMNVMIVNKIRIN